LQLGLVGVALSQLDNKMQDTGLANYEKLPARVATFAMVIEMHTNTHTHT